MARVAVGEVVSLLGRSADAGWYRIRTAQGVVGWVAAPLISVPADALPRIPVVEAP